ncbi:hypothetical protein AB0451_34755 [Streptomyces sp. NPDC052000]|uniref:hypothetical protein n=1 Tax=Streptomyces sp. NPDC052000 TaxID=3155676 RepID=UPI00344C5F64
MTDDRLSQIARALNRREWLPTATEMALGNAFFERVNRLVKEPQVPADLPPLESRWEAWLIQDLSLHARLHAEVEGELLPLWRGPLTDSPMLWLVERWVEIGRELLPFAERLLAAWNTAPPIPTAAELAAEQDRAHDPEWAAAQLRLRMARQWEVAVIPTVEQTDLLEPAAMRLAKVRSVLTAATTGDVDY